MGIVKQRLHRKNETGGYDVVHLETDSSLVKMEDECSLQDTINKLKEMLDTGEEGESDIIQPVKNGGTGKSAWMPNGIVYAPAENVLAQLPCPTTDGCMLVCDSTGSPRWVSIDAIKTELDAMEVPDGKYGFLIKVYDVDGVTPLPNIILTGISDISSELRTDANGMIRFNSSVARHNVKFSNLPGRLTLATSVFPSSIQGYINSLTRVTIRPDVSTLYGYDITLMQSDGVPAINTPVYTGLDFATLIGTTGEDGKLMIYSTNAAQNFAAVITNSSRRVYTNTTVSGTLGEVAAQTIMVDKLVYSGALAVGNIITFNGANYRVVHDDGNLIYCGRETMTDKTIYGSSNVYSGSTIAYKCTVYLNSIPAELRYFLQDVTVENVKNKVFIPTLTQVSSVFTYFNSDARRICNLGSAATVWWLSAPGTTYESYTYCSYVNVNGKAQAGFLISASNGFRPFIAFKK